MNDEIFYCARNLYNLLHARSVGIVTAESCTGGMVASAITAIEGASDVFYEGLVTYANASKSALLNVPAQTLQKHGAVSKETANAMLDGALSGANQRYRLGTPKESFSITGFVGISITGIAGPSGGTKDKPVGTVYIASGFQSSRLIEKCHFKGDRTLIRSQATLTALQQACALMSNIKKQ